MAIRYLLVLIPLAFILSAIDAHPVMTFMTAGLAIVPLSGVMVNATKVLTERLGHRIAGLANTSMGTIPDIMIGIFALHHGLEAFVKASITGAIMCNLLLGVGFAILAASRHAPQGVRFDLTSSHLLSGLMLLATIGLIIPAIFSISTDTDQEISFEVSVVLIATYLASVYFTLRQPGSMSDMPSMRLGRPNHKSGRKELLRAFAILIAAGIVMAVMSEILTHAAAPAAEALGFTPIFAGIFLLAPVGSGVELLTAVRFANQKQFDLALGIAIGCSSQMALLAAPLLVLTGDWMGRPMNLLFSEFQVIAVIIAVVAVNYILNIGMVRGISGIKLLAIYIMLGIGFYYQPAV